MDNLIVPFIVTLSGDPGIGKDNYNDSLRKENILEITGE